MAGINSNFAKTIGRLRSQKFRYLLVGGWNTLFGYLSGVGLFLLLRESVAVPVIGLLANILGITMSFLTYKLWVFRTQGRWLEEYFKCYLVYGSSAMLGVGLLWLFTEQLNVPIWYAQGLIIAITVMVSYMGHSRVTFKPKDQQKRKETRGKSRASKKKNQSDIALLQRGRKRR